MLALVAEVKLDHAVSAGAASDPDTVADRLSLATMTESYARPHHHEGSSDTAVGRCGINPADTAGYRSGLEQNSPYAVMCCDATVSGIMMPR